jgi:hypothetical protein
MSKTKKRVPKIGDLWKSKTDKSIWKITDIATKNDEMDYVMSGEPFCSAPLGTKIVYCINYSDGRNFITQAKDLLEDMLEDCEYIGSHEEKKVTKLRISGEVIRCPYCFKELDQQHCECGTLISVKREGRLFHCSAEIK